MDSDEYDYLMQLWHMVRPYGPEKDLPPPPFNLVEHLARQRKFSEAAFGPGPRTRGLIDHIKKELAEIQEAPWDLMEWVDVITLGLDGAWRSGASPEQIVAALVAKLTENEGRTWPRHQSQDAAVEHDRTVPSRTAKRDFLR